MWLSAFGAWIAFLSIVKCQTPPVRCTNHLTRVTLEVSPLLLSSICADNSPTQILISSDTGFRIDDVHGFCTSFDLNIGSVKMNYDVTSTSLTLQLLKNGETLDAARVVTIEAEDEGSDLVSVWGHRNTRLVLKIVRTCFPDANAPIVTTPTTTPGQATSTTEESTPETPAYSTTSTTTHHSLPGPNNPHTPTQDNDSQPVENNKTYNSNRNNMKKDNASHKSKGNAKTKLSTTTPSSRVLAKLQWMEEKRIAFEKKMKMLREYVPNDYHRNVTSPEALDNNNKNIKSIQTSTSLSNQQNINARLSSNSAGSRRPTEHRDSNKNVSLGKQNESTKEQLTTAVPTTIVNNSAYMNNQIKQEKSENTTKIKLLNTSSIVPTMSEDYQQWLPKRRIIPSPSGINGHPVTSKEAHSPASHGTDTTSSPEYNSRQSYDYPLNTHSTDTNTKSIDLFPSSYPNHGEDPTSLLFIATESPFSLSETLSEYRFILPTPVVSYTVSYDDTESSTNTILSTQYRLNANIPGARPPGSTLSSPIIGPAAFFPFHENKPTSIVFHDDFGNTIMSKEDHSSSFNGKDLKSSEILVFPTEAFTVTTEDTLLSSTSSAISPTSISSSFGHRVTSKSTYTTNHLTITHPVMSSSGRWNAPASGNNKNPGNPVYSLDNEIFTSAVSSLNTLPDTLIPSSVALSSQDFYSSSLWQLSDELSDELSTSERIYPLPSTPPLVSLQTAPTTGDYSTPLTEQMSSETIKVSKTEELLTTSYVISENVENSTVPLREKEEAVEEETFWPVVAALVVGIPSVIVFGIAIVVIHRRRQPLTRKAFAMRSLSSSAPSSVPDEMNRAGNRRSAV